MARPPKNHKFNEDVETHVVNQFYVHEVLPSKSLKEFDNTDFESTIDMMECKRTEKDYDWMSDFFFPHLPALINTDASIWASQYFQTRDFVEAKLEGGNPQNLRKCEAAKRCINGTLNNRGIHHYHKYIRGRLINALAGHVYAICFWNQRTIKELAGYQEQEPSYDQDGNIVQGEPIPVLQEKVTVDNFDYDVKDPRDVFTDSRYVYSIQDKDYITVRSEMTYEEMRVKEKDRGYFNLHIVKELIPQPKTETASETYDKNEQNFYYAGYKNTKFDVYLRFGKSWAVVKSTKEDGYPDEIVPGITRDGEISDRAVFIETISEFVVSGASKVLIRFQPQAYRDSKGNPYRPVVRGWCYIHPTKDSGLSDGKMNREIQVGINDCLNMAGDRTKLSTLPTLQAKKYALMDNPTIFFAPEHVMEVEQVGDIQEFKISDNVDGIINMATILEKKGQAAAAIYPSTMGELPEQSSTTATAVAGAELRTNTRGQYKSLTYENTFLLDFYWMIMQMTYQFATDETAEKLMGDHVYDFDPDQEYTFTPVSSNIELEYNKNKKISNYDQTLGRLAGMLQVAPALLPVMAHILRRQLELQGDEYPMIADMINKLANSQVNTEQGATSVANEPQQAASNQYGVPPSLGEEAARMRGTEAGMMMGGV